MAELPFALARSYTTHLIIQPSDLRLNPPESYLFVQDGLVIACGLLFSLCYIFYAIRTYSDKRLAGPIFGLYVPRGVQTCKGNVNWVYYSCGTLSYELFYAFTTTSTTFEKASFLIWFALDVIFTTTAVISTYRPGQRRKIAVQIFGGFVICVVALHILSLAFPDERQQVTAYWTGILLQLPIGWVSVYLLLKHRDTKGHSIEIW